MAASQFALPFRPAWDHNGKVIAGAQLYFTLAGTNTPVTVYSNAAMTQPLTNPVVANQAGRFPPIHYDSLVPIRVRLYDEDDVAGVGTPLEEYDPYLGYNDSLSASVFDMRVDPRDPPFNAVGDGATNDLVALQAAATYAFANGLPLDGQDAVFAVSGNLAFTGLTSPHIRSLRLKQLNPGTGRVTLGFTTCQKVRVDRVEVNLGTSAALGSMTSSAGFLIDGGSDHRIGNVEVFGDGKNSMFVARGLTDSQFENIIARDAVFNDAAATDDVLQGIWLDNCTDCQVNSPKAHDLTGNALYSGVPFANLRTRGLIMSGCVGVTVTNPQLRNVDQAIDLTGSAGNRNCVIVGGRSYNCGSVGVKLANSAVACKVVGHIAENTGFHGFLASGPAEAGLTYKTQDCDFIACTSINPGYNGISFADKSGFMIRAGSFDADFPKGIRFIGCTAIDNQTVKTMKYGFYNEGIAYDNVAKRPNQVVDCKSIGHTNNAEANFHRPVCRVNSLGAALATTTATPATILWDNESSPLEDSMAMHSTVTNTERVTVPVAGIYRIKAKTVWAASNTTGYRRTTLMKNGSSIAAVADAPVASENTVNLLDEQFDLAVGDYVHVVAEQNSGIGVNVTRSASYLHVELVREI